MGGFSCCSNSSRSGGFWGPFVVVVSQTLALTIHHPPCPQIQSQCPGCTSTLAHIVSGRGFSHRSTGSFGRRIRGSSKKQQWLLLKNAIDGGVWLTFEGYVNDSNDVGDTFSWLTWRGERCSQKTIMEHFDWLETRILSCPIFLMTQEWSDDSRLSFVGRFV